MFGDGGGAEANFNNGSTIVVRIGLLSGPTAPTCGSASFAGFTGETNNLYFVQPTTPPPSGTLPAIVFTKSSVSSSTSPCNSAVSVMPGVVAGPGHVVYTYCIGEYHLIAGGGCQSGQKYWDCWHNSQDYALGEYTCHGEKYYFFKTMRTQPPVGGDECGYSYGLMFCSNTGWPDMSCGPSDNQFGCVSGPVKYP